MTKRTIKKIFLNYKKKKIIEKRSQSCPSSKSTGGKHPNSNNKNVKGRVQGVIKEEMQMTNKYF